MAGDHKCPVCSSTFTRPQHVARHMRSHTGDRPYKCVHCGDQFARSDLLSRHVNKCHASEKPPTTTQPARRKGHAQPGSSSAGGVRGPAPPLIPPPGTRKICDACAHSRTPAQCDSGLPCGKCLQRNTKCTYPKANDIRRTTHDLFPPPNPALTVPSMARPPDPAPTFPSQPAFNFTVPLYPQPLDSSPASYPPPPFDPATTTAPEGASGDLMNRCFRPPVYPPQQPQPPPAFQPYPPVDLPAFLYSDPPPGQQQYTFDPAYYDQQLTYPQPQAYPQPDPFPAAAHQQQQGYQPEAIFSSAFGLMSLDDPAVAAEMTKTGAYFAPGALRGNKLPDLTAAAAAAAAAATPGRDANIAELRDFWKAFMRDHTPGGESKTPAAAAAADLTRPGARRSLSKMASLPDIKTPPLDGGPHYSTVEEARHTREEDLRSYEQAVLARTTPVNLTLAPPRRRQQHQHESPDTTSTTSTSTSTSADGDVVPVRPGFKRLASQTLGPFESKSVKVSHPHADAIAAYESGGAASHVRGGGGYHVRSPSGEYTPAMHRDRRLSVPTSGRPHEV